jgi:DNA-binding response OmpR family regulator
LLALQSQETGESAEPATVADGAPLVLVKSELMGLQEAFGQAGISSPVRALEDIESAKTHLQNQGSETVEAPIFVDLDLGEAAFEFIEWAKENGQTKRSPIVVLSRPGDIAAVSRAADAGAGLFIVKPVTAQKLSQLGEWIPSIRTNTEFGAPRPERDSAAKETINLSRPEILYVAASPPDRHLFSTAMSEVSVTFAVEFLQSFADVVEYVRQKGASRRITSAAPCCLLLDHATVGDASREVLRWIRNQSSFPDVVVVLLSDTDDPITVKSMYRAGTDYYLVKPKSFAGLLSIVGIIEAGSRQEPQAFDDFANLPEYRDRFGNPPTPDPGAIQCAE